jgi:septum formation protein
MVESGSDDAANHVSGRRRLARIGVASVAAMTRLILASQSPARLATLRAAGIEPEVIVSHVDEEKIQASMVGAEPAEIARVLAQAKAEEVARGLTTPALVVGCDSVFEIDGMPFGKPDDANIARQRWADMMGREGILHTGHYIIDTASGKTAAKTASTVVHMGTMTDEEIEAYLATGEPLRVAGGFTLDGLGGAFIDGIEGDPSNVVGISLPTVRQLFAELDVRWTSLWNKPT